MQRLDYYEFLGYLAPGGALLFGVSRVYPEVGTALAASSLTIGDLGIFVILSYATGHAVQAIGNVIEAAWWGLWGGWPSDWPRSSKHALLSTAQLNALPQRVAALLGTAAQVPLTDYDRKGWQAVVSQIGASLKAANRTERLDVFNGNYGLCRGLLAGAIVLIALCAAGFGCSAWKAQVGLAIVAVLMLCRMHRFGWRYARELFTQYLDLTKGAS